MKISFEIVPRNETAFKQQYEFASSLGQAIQIINVPDIQRFKIRSWETGKFVNRNKHLFIPHFRAIDFEIKSGIIFQIIEQYQLDQILLVTGDPPTDINHTFYNTNVIDLIKAVKQRFPKINIFAGFDPHRSGLQDEYNYIMHKADAGASGFFSQPFFDIRLIEIYAGHMQNLEIFIGLSPITTDASMHYWQVKNKVQFPVDFKAEYQWNIDFANRVIDMARYYGLNIYFMPIKIDLNKYFADINLQAN